MSRAILIIGESGSGKTTSCRNLDPKTTFYIDCDGKGLSWKGWKKQYNAENNNYKSSDSPYTVNTLIQTIATKPNAAHIKTIVVDTLNGIMVGEEERTRNDRGFDKWADLAWSVWEIISNAHAYRDDLTLVFMAHAQTERTDDGYMWTRMKTTGRKLDKLVPESKFTVVFKAKAVNGNYTFETHSMNSTAKTPLGMFDTDEIDNDIVKIIKAMEEYENEDA